MSWTERQQVLLQEMGVHLWPGATSTPIATSTVDVQPPPAPTATAPALRPPTPPLAADEVPTQVAQASSPALPIQIASATAAAQMGWPALAQAVQSCRACGLCESRTQTVFGVGNTQARWMLVGEAPGEQEDLKGEPFVGKAGQLLDSMLRALGLTRSEAPPEQQVYIANVLKCRPPHNRNPQPEEVERCEPYLVRQVELVQPRLILAMGRFAVQSLLRTQEPIGRLRGKVHRYQGVPVVVTYHPAYLLRNPLDKARSWEDLCLARSLLTD